MALALPVMIAMDDQKRTAILAGIVYFLIYLTTSYASRNAGRMSRKIGDIEKTLNLTFLAGALGLALTLVLYLALVRPLFSSSRNASFLSALSRSET